MRTYALALMLVLLAATTAHAQKPYRMAILEFEPVTEDARKDNLGRVGAEFLITAAVNSATFSVVERAAISKVLEELHFGQGSGSPATAAQAIGGMVGARGVLTGSVAKTGNSVRLDARLIDVADGSIVAARSAYAKSDLRSLATAAELLVSQLEGDVARLASAAKTEAAPDQKAGPKTEPKAEPAPRQSPGEGADRPAPVEKSEEKQEDVQKQ